MVLTAWLFVPVPGAGRALAQGTQQAPASGWSAQSRAPLTGPSTGAGTVTAPQPPQPQQAAPPAPPVAAPPAPSRAANTTVITKTPDRSVGMADKGRGTLVSLQALLIENGARIDQGLVWRIYDATLADNKHKLLTTLKDASPSIRLAPGDYMINAAFGRAHITRRITIKPGEQQAETFVLNAGGLRVTSFVASGEPAPERTTQFDIYSDERDQSGNRAKVMANVKTGLIVRLNAGIYHVVSTFGDANATERADVTVEAGKLTEATVRHSAARVTLRLVAQAGGEAQADTRWLVHTAEGQLVKESLGALPTHILQAGSYTVVAHQGGARFSAAFAVAPGEVKQVEVMMKQP